MTRFITFGTMGSRGPKTGQAERSYDVAGFTNTTRLTRSGRAAATAMARIPPKDSPNRYTGRSGEESFTSASKKSL